jgi:hypothetical protein
MSTPPLTDAQLREVLDASEAHFRHVDAAAFLGLHVNTYKSRLERATIWAAEQAARGEVDPTKIETLPGRAFILTSAQSGTKLFTPFWDNLKAFARLKGAEILVSRYRYNISQQQAKQSKTDATASSADWYAPEIEPYACDRRVRLCDGLIFAGDMNILPTATDPLSGLDSFTGIESCIFPHAKIALKSIATAMDDPRKKNYTTGTVTLSNYIQRKAGQKAEFHHAYGALFVEIDDDGDFFVRQLNAGHDGAFFDLDVRVRDGKIGRARIAAFSAGDIHARNIDPVVKDATWGEGGLVDTLRPERQFLGDILDFESRSHHNTLFDSYRLHVAGGDSVEGEIEDTFRCVADMTRPWCQTYVKKANHDEHLERWLREANFKTDLLNAPFYLEAMAAVLRAIREGDKEFDLLQWALARVGEIDVTFLPRNQSFIVAGIDMGQHGDLGPNGSRGTPRNISRTGRKANIEHSHSAQIVDGAYQAGTSTRLDLSYVRGPSSWSHCHIITDENGKRQIIEIKNGKWKA